jgi:hypothetical protein
MVKASLLNKISQAALGIRSSPENKRKYIHVEFSSGNLPDY